MFDLHMHIEVLTHTPITIGTKLVKVTLATVIFCELHIIQVILTSENEPAKIVG